jgi:DNA anti-recombination protein RmuC
MPEASPYAVGIIVSVIMALTLWLFEYRRDQREMNRETARVNERAQDQQAARVREMEPRLDPPAHKHFATKEEVQRLEIRANRLDEKIDHNFTDLNSARSKSIEGLHRRIETEAGKLRDEMREDNSGTHKRIDAVLAGVSRLEGLIEGQSK